MSLPTIEEALRQYKEGETTLMQAMFVMRCHMNTARDEGRNEPDRIGIATHMMAALLNFDRTPILTASEALDYADALIEVEKQSRKY